MLLRLSALTRCLAVVLAGILAAGLLPWAWAPLVVPAASPLVAVSSAIAQRSLAWIMLLGVPVLVMVVLRRRWFCRFACPVGLLVQHAGRLSPMPKTAFRRLPRLGRWSVLMTLAGACVGYPVLVWLDPLAIFSAFFGLWHRPVATATVMSALGLPVVLVLSLLLPGIWCGRVCPLGACQELLALRKTAAPPSNRGMEQETTLEENDSLPILSRRTVVALGLGACWAGAALPALRGAGRQAPIRPPGAADEARFTGLCVRCGNCVRACPAKILQADMGEHGLAALLTPVVHFGGDYCRENCHRCTQVCPSGAIARLSLDEKKQARMGIAKVDMALCVLGDDRECQVCRNHCPYEAISIAWSEESYTNAPQVDAAKCPGCGACEAACITSPQKAIRVVPLSGAPIKA